MFPLNPIFQKTNLPKSANARNNGKFKTEANKDKLNWEWYAPPEESVPVEFCMDTSLHGLKYLGQQRRHILERIFWLAAFVASTSIAVTFIWGMWNDYRNTPIVTVFHSEEKTIEEIPFPSVTICNINAIQKSSYDDYVQKTIWSLPKRLFGFIQDDHLLKSLAKYVDMNYICDSCSTFVDQLTKNTTLQQGLKKIKEAVAKNLNFIVPYLDPAATLLQVSQPCHKMILACMWQDKFVNNCSDIFQEVITEHGLCCSFNSVPTTLLLKNFAGESKESPNFVQDWRNSDLDHKLDYENLIIPPPLDIISSGSNIPYRQRYVGRQAGLTVLLDPDLDEYKCTHTDSEGFMMGINVPLDFPKVKDKGIAIKTKAEVFVGLRPDIITSEDTIRRFPLHKRKCYFENEYDLKHYTKYTTSNCMNECFTERLYQICRCVRYYLPRNQSIPDLLCKPGWGYDCAEIVQQYMIQFGLGKVCPRCLPTCTEIEYHHEISVLPLQTDKIKKYHDNFFDKRNVRRMSIVHVYFNVDSVYPKLRKELITITQLLSNTGGLLGLCMGFSVLSLLEIIYYGTIRLWCSCYRDRTIMKRNSSTTTSTMENDQPFHPQQSWFVKILNKFSFPRNKDKTEIIDESLQSRRDDVEYNNIENNIFITRCRESKLPTYFQSSFEDQFQKTFLTDFQGKRQVSFKS